MSLSVTSGLQRRRRIVAEEASEGLGRGRHVRPHGCGFGRGERRELGLMTEERSRKPAAAPGVCENLI